MERYGCLLRGSKPIYGCGVCRQGWFGNEEVVIVEVAIHASGNFRSFGAESRATAFQENNYDDVTDIGLSVGGEPPEAGARVRAGSGLAQNFFLIEVSPQTARGTELYCALHSVGNFWNQRGNVQAALYHRLEIRDIFRSRGMLQIIERAAISDGRDQRAKLQRGDGNAFAEGAHLPDAAKFGGDFFVGINPELLTGYAIASQLAEAVLMRVITDFFKSQLAAKGFEIRIVRVRQRHGQVHMVAAT